ncbi:carbohydrate kinase [Petroclostridium sp. X23]|uniref:carbohydrate kinase family protein n=1 Tax=Petroclostridium sp. X23 TaxID=3045146 RepID=UPI0024AE5659|nr:carbohydrate kinase [Petroclostridium sp. X23]WHH60341.1 carbohydrate kinase [Petroclostridium sp. X23]
MFDVVALGELLIDFTPYGLSQQNNKLFECNPGGAPCNVLSMLAKAGFSTAFIGKIGMDIFGEQLEKTLIEVGIDSSGLVKSSEVNTTLAFVRINENGDRDFAFYRNPGADMRLEENEVKDELLKNTKIFHFGTLSMTHDGVRKATKKALAIAKEHNALISFDPNLRPPLWKQMEDAREQMLFGCSQCDILKIEEEELKFMLDCKTVDEGIAILNEKFKIKLIIVTSGEKGSAAYYNNISVKKPAFLNRDTVDTTGAGDTFCGCCLAYVLVHGIEELSKIQLEEMLVFANGAASIVTTRKGAIRAMPYVDEVYEYIENSEQSIH